jgi:hypothetical protein
MLSTACRSIATRVERPEVVAEPEFLGSAGIMHANSESATALAVERLRARAISPAMPKGLVVRLTAAFESMPGLKPTMLAMVATEDPEVATAAVRRMVDPGCEIFGVVSEVSEETVARLDIQPGQVRIL